MFAAENIKEESENFLTLVEPSDQSNYSASAVYIDTMYKLNWNKLIDWLTVLHHVVTGYWYAGSASQAVQQPAQPAPV